LIGRACHATMWYRLRGTGRRPDSLSRSEVRLCQRGEKKKVSRVIEALDEVPALLPRGPVCKGKEDHPRIFSRILEWLCRIQVFVVPFEEVRARYTWMDLHGPRRDAHLQKRNKGKLESLDLCWHIVYTLHGTHSIFTYYDLLPKR
jgi:hypothetical protein